LERFRRILKTTGRFIMLWLQILIVGSIAVLFAVALVLRLRHAAATSSAPRTERRKILAAIGMLAVGAAFWLSISRDDAVDMPWTWSLSIVLGLLAVLAAARPRTGSLVVLVTAVAAPVLALVGMASIYALGSGVSDGAGGTESFATMAMVSVTGAAAAYSAPAAVTAALLRPGVPKAAVGAPGSSEKYQGGDHEAAPQDLPGSARRVGDQRVRRTPRVQQR
jgi:hypothetical protein